MKRERYSIIYSSKTGNTKKLAEAIYNTLPQNKCDYYGTVDKIDDVLSNVIYIGFWTEKGNADHLTIDFLNKLRNKKIFLFGTAGYGESEKYFEGIINNVKKNIDSSNTIIGSFMCQGKMPLSVRERYEKMREQNNISLNLEEMKRIENQKMSKMPFTYLMYRLAVKGVMKKNFPDEGFETEWIRCDKTEIHFDLHRCIYNDLTKEYEFPELCTVFCENDDIAFNGLMPKIRFERNGTLGQGMNKCDFHLINNRKKNR